MAPRAEEGILVLAETVEGGWSSKPRRSVAVLSFILGSGEAGVPLG
jgi:hypothetical protein